MHDIFYFTDVHGQLDLFQTMRDWCYKQDPECMIVYGGDACDRGEFGFDIMEMIIDDPQIVYIRGNHEDMFINAALAILDYIEKNNLSVKTIDQVNELIGKMRFISEDVNLHLYNYGKETLKTWLLSEDPKGFVKKLCEKMTYVATYENLYFTHAGGSYDTVKRVIDANYNSEESNEDDNSELIWDREMLNDVWPEDTTIIFGHTPVFYLREFGVFCPEVVGLTEKNSRPIMYTPLYAHNSGKHIAMDTGMTFNGRGYVLNCLTMQLQGFYDINVRYPDFNKPIRLFENYKII